MTARMSAGPIWPQLNRTYKSCTPYQWVREAYVNSAQGKATFIHFDVEWEAVKQLGVHRRIVRDNGHGIARKDVMAFLNKFGGTGKTLAAIEENYGIGVKVTTLPWNKYGVIVITKQGEEITLLWLHWDEDLGDYGAREFNLGTEVDPDIHALIPLEEYPDGIEIDGVDWGNVYRSDQDGLCLILCGDAADQDTVLGDPGRDEGNKYGLVQYLNGRLYDIPETVKVHVTQYENWGDKTKWPRSAADVVQVRQPDGLQRTLNKAAIATKAHPGRGITAEGVLEIPSTPNMLGANIHWRLHNESVFSRGDIITVPMAAVKFKSHDDVMEVFHLAAKGLDEKAVAKQMNPFVKVASVRDRLSLIIEPLPTEGVTVFPDSGRSRLYWETSTSGAQELPWGDWVAAWDAQTPTPIKQAIADYYKSLATGDSDLTEDDYQRLAEKYESALRSVKRLVRNAKGTLVGVPSSTGGTGRTGGGTKPVTPGGNRTTPVAKPQQPVDPTKPAEPVSERTVKGGLVTVYCDPHMDEKAWAVTLDEKARKATVNMKSPSYTRCHDFIMEKYDAQKKVPTQDKRDIVSAGVQRAVETHVALALTEILTDSKVMGADDREAALSDAAVSNVLKGIRAIEEIASGSIGQQLSGKAKSEKRSGKSEAAKIRKWARENGHAVGDRGVISPAVREAYHAALAA